MNRSDPPKVGFTGTRRGMTAEQAAVFEGLLQKMESFHHGSCEGADIEAARIVHKTFLSPPSIVAHPGPDGDPHRAVSGVDSETLPPKNHFARNRDIVDQTDYIIACPAEMERQPRGGTWYTFDYAMKKGKPVVLIGPDGSIMHHATTDAF